MLLVEPPDGASFRTKSTAEFLCSPPAPAFDFFIPHAESYIKYMGYFIPCIIPAHYPTRHRGCSPETQIQPALAVRGGPRETHTWVVAKATG